MARSTAALEARATAPSSQVHLNKQTSVSAAGRSVQCQDLPLAAICTAANISSHMHRSQQHLGPHLSSVNRFVSPSPLRSIGCSRRHRFSVDDQAVAFSTAFSALRTGMQPCAMAVLAWCRKFFIVHRHGYLARGGCPQSVLMIARK